MVGMNDTDKLQVATFERLGWGDTHYACQHVAEADYPEVLVVVSRAYFSDETPNIGKLIKTPDEVLVGSPFQPKHDLLIVDHRRAVPPG